MAVSMTRVPVREQEPLVRAKNFEEVCLGYSEEEAVAEAERCLHCAKPLCVQGCPVSINIPEFIQEVKNRDFKRAYDIINESSSLPAVCGRVCPQETQCEGKCILGKKGDPVSIGKLERFVADWASENGVAPAKTKEQRPERVAVIGSGPAGLTCAGDLAKMGYQVKIFEALHQAGGVLVYGIPEFRLPKDQVVAHEVENVKKLGVEIETDVVVGKSVTIDQLMDEEGFDDFTRVRELLGLATGSDNGWYTLRIGELKAMLALAGGDLEQALVWTEWTMEFNSSVFSPERANYYRCLQTLLLLAQEEDRQPLQYLNAFVRMYGADAVEAASAAMSGEAAFYGLQPVDSDLHAFAAHQSLLKAYEKLQRAKAAFWAK